MNFPKCHITHALDIDQHVAMQDVAVEGVTTKSSCKAMGLKACSFNITIECKPSSSFLQASGVPQASVVVNASIVAAGRW
jgi:hypothetical protein